MTTAPNAAFLDARARRDPVDSVIDQLRADAIIEAADRLSSLWQSVALAAWRGDATVIRFHCAEIATLTRETFKTVRELGGAGKAGSQ
jgi:hypothetical protein